MLAIWLITLKEHKKEEEKTPFSHTYITFIYGSTAAFMTYLYNFYSRNV